MKKKAPASKMMKKHVKEEKKDLQSDKKLLKQDMSMKGKMKGKC